MTEANTDNTATSEHLIARSSRTPYALLLPSIHGAALGCALAVVLLGCGESPSTAHPARASGPRSSRRRSLRESLLRVPAWQRENPRIRLLLEHDFTGESGLNGWRIVSKGEVDWSTEAKVGPDGLTLPAAFPLAAVLRLPEKARKANVMRLRLRSGGSRPLLRWLKGADNVHQFNLAGSEKKGFAENVVWIPDHPLCMKCDLDMALLTRGNAPVTVERVSWYSANRAWAVQRARNGAEPGSIRIAGQDIPARIAQPGERVVVPVHRLAGRALRFGVGACATDRFPRRALRFRIDVVRGEAVDRRLFTRDVDVTAWGYARRVETHEIILPNDLPVDATLAFTIFDVVMREGVFVPRRGETHPTPNATDTTYGWTGPRWGFWADPRVSPAPP